MIFSLFFYVVWTRFVYSPHSSPQFAYDYLMDLDKTNSWLFANSKKLVILQDVIYCGSSQITSKKALNLYVHAIDLVGEEPVLLSNIGAIYMKRQDYDNALIYYKKALNAKSKLDLKNNKTLDSLFNSNIADYYVKIGDFRTAKEYLRMALANKPDFSAPYLLSGYVAYKQNNYKICNHYYDIAWEMGFTSDNMEDFIAYIDCLSVLKPKETDRRKKVVISAMKYFPAYPEFHYLVAQLDYDLKQYNDAYDQATEAVILLSYEKDYSVKTISSYFGLINLLAREANTEYIRLMEKFMKDIEKSRGCTELQLENLISAKKIRISENKNSYMVNFYILSCYYELNQMDKINKLRHEILSKAPELQTAIDLKLTSFK